MGTKLVRNIIADASAYLADEGTRRKWGQALLLKWLNYAEKAICLVKPDAYSAVVSSLLVPGTRQTKPETLTMIGRVTRNTGSAGATPGKVITEMDLDTMDQGEDWHTTTAATVVKHFIRIPGDNGSFFVWPPVHATTPVYIEMSGPALPADIAVTDWVSGTQTINLPDVYVNPILELILFRACDMLSSSNDAMTAKANQALSRAIQMITGKSDAEAQTRVRGAAGKG